MSGTSIIAKFSMSLSKLEIDIESMTCLAFTASFIYSLIQEDEYL